MKINHIKIFLSALVFMPICINAQTNTVGNEEVIIVKEFDAKIKDADKINESPSIPEIAEPKISIDYNIPTKEFKDISIEANPLKPIGMPKEKLTRYNSSYIKLGFGSQLSPLLEFVYNGKGNKIAYGVGASHFNAWPTNIKNQRFFDNTASAYITGYPSTFKIGSSFKFHNRIVHFYGNQNNEIQTRKDIQRTLQDFDGKIFFGSNKKNKADIEFLTTLRFDYFRDLFGKTNEYFINGNIQLSKQINKMHKVGGYFEYDGSNYITSSSKLWRNYYLLGVKYNITYKDLIGHAGITLAIEGDKAFPLPDIYLQKGLYEKYIVAYAGWKISYRKNSFRDFALQNNFITPSIELRNSRVSDLNIGLKGAIDDFQYNAMFSYKAVSNQDFFYSDYFDSRQFYIAYDPRVNILNGHIELGYHITPSLFAAVGLDYNHYKLSTNELAWYRPNFLGDLKLRYNIKEKIIIGAEVYGFSSYYGHVATNDIRKIKGTADANISINYIFNKKFSFFGYLNNIAHQRYERWANYPVLGINGIVGAKFSF